MRTSRLLLVSAALLPQAPIYGVLAAGRMKVPRSSSSPRKRCALRQLYTTPPRVPGNHTFSDSPCAHVAIACRSQTIIELLGIMQPIATMIDHWKSRVSSLRTNFLTINQLNLDCHHQVINHFLPGLHFIGMILVNLSNHCQPISSSSHHYLLILLVNSLINHDLYD